MCSPNQAATPTSLLPVVFCHLFYEVSGTSACNSVGLPLSKPRAPRLLAYIYYITSSGTLALDPFPFLPHAAQ